MVRRVLPEIQAVLDAARTMREQEVFEEEAHTLDEEWGALYVSDVEPHTRHPTMPDTERPVVNQAYMNMADGSITPLGREYLDALTGSLTPIGQRIPGSLEVRTAGTGRTVAVPPMSDSVRAWLGEDASIYDDTAEDPDEAVYEAREAPTEISIPSAVNGRAVWTLEHAKGELETRLIDTACGVCICGGKNTHEHVSLFCMRFFVVDGSAVTIAMREFARRVLKDWRTYAGPPEQEAYARLLVLRLVDLMAASRDNVRYGTASTVHLAQRVYPTGLLETLRERQRTLYFSKESRATQTKKVVVARCWTRKIRINR